MRGWHCGRGNGNISISIVITALSCTSFCSSLIQRITFEILMNPSNCHGEIRSGNSSPLIEIGQGCTKRVWDERPNFDSCTCRFFSMTRKLLRWHEIRVSCENRWWRCTTKSWGVFFRQYSVFSKMKVYNCVAQWHSFFKILPMNFIFNFDPSSAADGLPQLTLLTLDAIDFTFIHWFWGLVQGSFSLRQGSVLLFCANKN